MTKYDDGKTKYWTNCKCGAIVETRASPDLTREDIVIHFKETLGWNLFPSRCPLCIEK